MDTFVPIGIKTVLAYTLMTLLLLPKDCFPQDLDGEERGGDYCHTEIFRAECAVGEIILMKRALYGRMALGRCVETDMGYLGCHDNVIRIADRRCSGRRTCEIRVPDAEFEQTRPCLKELKTYLEIAYICIKVETVTNDYCELHNEINVTSSDHGFISSTAMLNTPSCSGSSHPWYIIAQPGQRINLTLYDFSVRVSYDAKRNDQGDASDKKKLADEDGQDLLDICDDYGMLEDPIASKTTLICGGNRRASQFYLSEGHILKVWVTMSNDKLGMKYFILEYTVTGCPDPVTNDLVWFKAISGTKAEMGCHYSDVTWTMECKDHTWEGDLTNCTLPAPEESDKQRQNFPFTYGVAIVIIIGAALGVAFVIFIVGLVRYRRRPRCRDNINNRTATIPLRHRAECEYEAKSQSLPSQTCRLMDDQTKVPNSNTSESPCTPLCRYQSHPVKVNGNEYEHIWEAPLPVPNSAKADVTCTITTLPRHMPHAHAAALSFSTFKAPDVIHGTDNTSSQQHKPLYVSSKDILSCQLEDSRTSLPTSPEHYSTLDKRLKMENRKNTNV